MSTEINSLNGYLLKDETARQMAGAITVPTKLSELAEDASHRLTTDEEKAAWDAKSNFSGDYNDLTNKPTIPTVPTNVSAFANDAGYLTEHQDISGKLDASALPEAVNAALSQAKESGEFDGPQGEKGATGPAGPQGPQGEKGDTGAAGSTPVKGVDYWTAEDKAEMVSEVIAALPDASEVSY